MRTEDFIAEPMQGLEFSVCELHASEILYLLRGVGCLLQIHMFS